MTIAPRFRSDPAIGTHSVLESVPTVESLPDPILRESRALFHDVRPADIDPEKHAAFVIARVLDRGTLGSVRALLGFYGTDRLRAFLVGSQAYRVAPRTAAFWRAFLGVSEPSCTQRSSFPRSSRFWTG